MDKIDYYRTLGLSNTASSSEIKRAYRKLAMKYHPDRNHGNEEWAHDKFKDINEAFNILGDPEKKRKYDQFGITGNVGDTFGNTATRTTLDDLVDDFGGDDYRCDYLDGIFDDYLRGTGFAFQKFKRKFSGIRRSRFETQRGVYFEDLFEDIKSPIGSSVNYEIVLSKEQAFMGIEKELVRNGKRIKIKIPAGAKMGSRIRLRNALKITDSQPGDITINIKVK